MKRFAVKVFSVCLVVLSVAGCHRPGGTLLYSSPAYAVYGDSVTQGPYTARALSATEMRSGYRSPALRPLSPVIAFKFSINGADNEAPAGRNHLIACVSGACATPAIPFGTAWSDTSKASRGAFLHDGTKLTVSVDMNKVLDAFKRQGYFTTFDGHRIYKNDFSGVYVAGNTAPLTWDFANLARHGDLQLKDPDGDGVYTLTIALHPKTDTTASHWKLSASLGGLPRFKSDHTLVAALYNLSLEEMQRDIRSDSTFMAGAEWDGVWTRDISYSMILSLAMLHPGICRRSLMRKVKNGMIIQDTGTGGSYPVSTDRMLWAIAAWEVYKVTGDRDWLKQAYAIIRKSALADAANIYDPVTGMARGESSFMDWREQTYPKWMQPVDIFQSECLGTNAVHYEAHSVLASMATLLGDASAAATYRSRAEAIKKGVNRWLWQPSKGYYGQYLYGKNYPVLSPRSESLGESMCVLFGLAPADHAASVIEKTPVLDYGLPCIYPQIPGIPPYHNDAVWPFVDAYWTLAAARAGNGKAVLAGMSSLYRAAALFLTNKENFVAGNGDYIGTQVNSDRQLWSVAGNLAMVYRVLLGMHLLPDSLAFAPFVPASFKGTRSLTGFRYRGAVLDITVTGYGNRIRSFALDGHPLSQHAVAGSLKGHHTVRIRMDDNTPTGSIHRVKNHFSPATPIAEVSGNLLHWRPVDGAASYAVLVNGKNELETKDTSASVPVDGYGEYQVVAVDPAGFRSFASAPLVHIAEPSEQDYQLEKFAPASRLPYQGYAGSGFVVTDKGKNDSILMHITVPATGRYAIDFRYANGNGPINTDNKCAMRSIWIGNQREGTVIFPQRGQGQWSDWGFSSTLIVHLDKGSYPVTLKLQAVNENMNGQVNEAALDYMRVISVPQEKNAR